MCFYLYGAFMHGPPSFKFALRLKNKKKKIKLKKNKTLSSGLLFHTSKKSPFIFFGLMEQWCFSFINTQKRNCKKSFSFDTGPFFVKISSFSIIKLSLKECTSIISKSNLNFVFNTIENRKKKEKLWEKGKKSEKLWKKVKSYNF